MFIKRYKIVNKICSWACLLLILQNSHSSFAETSSIFELIEPKQKSQIWLNAGMYSAHFDKNNGFNNNNIGLGLEYRFSSVSSLTVGGFKNSDNTHSNYIGVYWQPFAIGPFNFGGVAGGFNGYQSTNNGGWFPALFPAVTIEGKWIGANLFIIPSIGDRVHGALSLQLKIKVLD